MLGDRAHLAAEERAGTRGRPASHWSIVATCTSSWFISVKRRSLADERFEREAERRDVDQDRCCCGAPSAPALP